MPSSYSNRFAKNLYCLSPWVVYHSSPKRKISIYIKNRLRSCGACVLNSAATHCLLVKQKSTQKWGFPKGSMEPGESFNKCMRRELWEETGLNINAFRHRVLGRETYHKYLIYVIHMNQQVNIPFTIQDQDEIDQVEWVLLEKIPTYSFNRVTEFILSKLLSKCKQNATDMSQMNTTQMNITQMNITRVAKDTLPVAMLGSEQNITNQVISEQIASELTLRAIEQEMAKVQIAAIIQNPTLPLVQA